MNKLLFGIGIVILVGVLGYGIYENKNMMPRGDDKAAMMQKEAEVMAMKEKEAMAMKEKEAMAAKENMTPEQIAMMKKEEAMKAGEVKKDGEVMMKKSAGMYIPYSADKLALAKDNKVIIFFHAAWCPTCRALDAEINSKGVKEGYIILKADYDTSKELKAKYGVTTQHTLVQVGATGAQIGKWSGGDLAGIYARAK